MNPTQLARQTALNEYLNAAIDAFLATHPDTELATILRALDDAKTDADNTRERALAESNLIDIDVEVTARTEKAVLVHVGIKEQAVWLPLSQIEIEPNGAFDGIETVTLPEWLALDKGLI